MTTGPLPRMTTKRIGRMRVDACVDAVGPARTAAEMLRDLPPTLVDDNRDWLVPTYLDAVTDRLILAYQSFLIQLDGVTILVDCAVGEDGEFPRPDWHRAKSDWLNHLGLAGCAPEDVDIVVLTHLHVDHTGWLTRKHADGWRPTFPHARHLTTTTELDFWREKHAEFPFMAQSVPDCVEPVHAAGLFAPIRPGDEIALGLTVVDLSGHSPGMVGLEYREDGLLLAAFNADLMHHPLQMTAPHMATLFCSDPAAAVATRRAKLADYAAAGTVMFCNHFPGESAGRVAAQGDGFVFRPVA